MATVAKEVHVNAIPLYNLASMRLTHAHPYYCLAHRGCHNWELYMYSRLQKSCNKQAEQWKTTIDLLCLNREVGHAEAER